MVDKKSIAFSRNNSELTISLSNSGVEPTDAQIYLDMANNDFHMFTHDDEPFQFGDVVAADRYTKTVGHAWSLVITFGEFCNKIRTERSITLQSVGNINRNIHEPMLVPNQD